MSSPEVLDVVGVGFGPANLALAIAIEEHNETCAEHERVRAVFVERQESFGWHPGMLLDGATMQIAFPKDLVTFRNPRSGFTFFNYLYERDRLVDFVNHQTFFPTRHEFHDYLSWAADRVDADVRFGTSVADITQDGDVLTVRCDDGTVVRTRNVSVGAGLTQRVPEWASLSARCFHNHDFLPRMAELPKPTHGRFVVLGAGQSAAEVVQYLHGHYPHAEVHSVFARYGYSPADDSPYANRIFDPSAVDELHRAPALERERLIALHRSTNYSVVDIELIEELYRAEYAERVSGHRRLFMRRASTIDGVVETADGIEVTIRDSIDGIADTLDCDALVLATGFRPAPLRPLLGELAPEDGGPRVVTRDYRLLATSEADTADAPGVYLQGGTETTHGITSSLLSNVAIRSGEILNSIVARRAGAAVLARVDTGSTGATTRAETDKARRERPASTFAVSEAR
ncbi:lysine N(6)-hydroxylase/L-ornithine N(5)-oxygenase family protein [Rhodococcus sp. BP-349]|uniref:lysine N(6)-hydroxylase/L-ornithine N(5)-oxygenase family protein n=1 Tax=unclassified Rhodococcus (in: high G+C Gram-positive bacteria) TaxID=192944 RepID=UPI001C9A5F82|nr:MULTISPECIES: SidA/IucD/PvdA family monooxygenase [unclassified Rhodococcus (in: high G+C Gram-positive bacteria)]MBY6537583.1 lysine N(6)-hydroxylase/L-ornithine N(5)-oxygenase family protein [Rhodococcus sp. BP-363]MBY6541920.1 lysine N(6)-hydroxylase/L-ornithine N(5)-oxygenase family protein [Rhodococcus sp. BP-369]MBY6561150.1 lysine N(6)-hydroxylase/L-ornithine N(5)-oxygenase family protein [Rhodococcus sp. BP-370]MBY6575442.1 lysine N(6)-hydroxylase/L-ornithine N(5)-oxygenase family pr